MKLLMYGVNQDTVSIDDIDRYKLSEQEKMTHLEDISAFSGVQEVCIISSEVRSEYYLNVDEKSFKHGDLLRYLSKHTDKPLKEIILETYSKFNKDVINHLLSTLSGMETKAKGSLATLKYAEAAMKSADEKQVLGNVLRKLFQKAIDFSKKMRISEAMRPLYLTDPSKTIEILKDRMDSLSEQKFVLFGTDYDTVHLAKLLLDLDAESITVIHQDAEISQKMISTLKDWVHLTNSEEKQTRLHAADLTSVGFRFCNADGIIVASSFDSELLSEELMMRIENIRQTEKKQVVVDFSEEKQEAFNLLGSLVQYEAPSTYHNNDFSDEEISNAELFFEENMTQVTERFMEEYQQMTELSLNQDPNRAYFNLAVGSEGSFDSISRPSKA
ncbi:hypothetical protein [Marinilactibacillus sp. Marseille-P9653]|uniref:hypothetical protein n=1 Tax=Marinilactibacillus sp. Marseille-P9653 TaxID=2866583 RepID=UPI001CE4729B|nr:hypothetical protein [Marinilactibacillus sp. Marseille-P9653]